MKLNFKHLKIFAIINEKIHTKNINKRIKVIHLVFPTIFEMRISSTKSLLCIIVPTNLLVNTNQFTVTKRNY